MTMKMFKIITRILFILIGEAYAVYFGVMIYGVLQNDSIPGLDKGIISLMISILIAFCALYPIYYALKTNYNDN